MNKLSEFFQGENNRLSMHRLLTFMAFFPASYVLLENRTIEALAVYLAAFVTNGVLNKVYDIKGRKK